MSVHRDFDFNTRAIAGWTVGSQVSVAAIDADALHTIHQLNDRGVKAHIGLTADRRFEISWEHAGRNGSLTRNTLRDVLIELTHLAAFSPS